MSEVNNILQNLNKRAVPVNPGEEWLHVVPKFKQAQGKRLTVLAGVDGGSTGTRVSLVTLQEMPDLLEHLKTVYSIPSRSKLVTDDRTLTPQSDYLYDNLDTVMSNTSNKQNPRVTRARLVRGLLADSVETQENRLKSTTQKVEDATFYYNLVDAVGMAVSAKFGEEIPETVDIYMSLALPPDEISPRNIQRLQSELQSYNWKLPNYGIEIKINFNAVNAITEPEAALRAYSALRGVDTSGTILHLDGGGRSTGAAILKNGSMLPQAGRSLLYAAKQLVDALGEAYTDKNGGSVPSFQALEGALRTGRLTDSSKEWIMPLVTEVKRTYGDRVANDLIDKVFDTQTVVTLRDVRMVSYSGGFFMPTMAQSSESDLQGYEEDGVSVGQFMAAKLKAMNNNLEFLHIDENFIPAGMLLQTIVAYQQQAQAQSATPAVEEDVQPVEVETTTLTAVDNNNSSDSEDVSTSDSEAANS